MYDGSEVYTKSPPPLKARQCRPEWKSYCGAEDEELACRGPIVEFNAPWGPQHGAVHSLCTRHLQVLINNMQRCF